MGIIDIILDLTPTNYGICTFIRVGIPSTYLNFFDFSDNQDIVNIDNHDFYGIFIIYMYFYKSVSRTRLLVIMISSCCTIIHNFYFLGGRA
jgi:hypothetical protein